MTLTERQLEVLEAVRALTRSAGFPPTMRELGVCLGISSSNGVSDHLRRLEVKGMLAPRPKNAARTLRITPRGLATLTDQGAAT